jgi:DNA-binding transcriptional LysR family regulator
MDRLTSTRVFVAVAEHGSLTAAADRLEMSTAMVSRHLAAAEAWLGARLLHRTTRRVSLTDAGQASLAACRQMLDMADEIRQQASERSRVASGRMRITSSPSFAEAQLAPALARFHRRHPQVSFSLLVSDRSMDLAADSIDLAVRITNQLEPTHVARRLADCRSVICAAPAYLRTQGRPKTLADLQAHVCLTHVVAGAAQFRSLQGQGAAAWPLHEGMTTNDTAVLRRAVLEGTGLGILPTYLVGDDLRKGLLRRVLPAIEPETLGVHAIMLSRQHQPLALRLLVEFLAKAFGGPVAPWDLARPPARVRA